MTDLSVMLKWYAPETVTLFCDECGREVPSVDGRNRKILCHECSKARRLDRANVKNRATGKVRYTFDDPAVDLVYAVINQAQIDRAWQRRHYPDGEALNLNECGAQEFIEDGGAELWLAALGIGIRPSMRRAIRELEAE